MIWCLCILASKTTEMTNYNQSIRWVSSNVHRHTCEQTEYFFFFWRFGFAKMLFNVNTTIFVILPQYFSYEISGILTWLKSLKRNSLEIASFWVSKVHFFSNNGFSWDSLSWSVSLGERGWNKAISKYVLKYKTFNACFFVP